MRLLKSRKALSTVVTTLIILVVSVLLATVVTFYAINATTTRVQEESLQITKLHVWCTNDGDASAAFMITNTGGRDVVLDKITVRGRECNTSYVYYWKLDDATPPDLEWVAGGNDPKTNLNSKYQSYGANFEQLGNKSLTLRSGARMVVYAYNLKWISTSDIGVSISVVVFTSNAQYYKETNVKAVIPTP